MSAGQQLRVLGSQIQASRSESMTGRVHDAVPLVCLQYTQFLVRLHASDQPGGRGGTSTAAAGSGCAAVTGCGNEVERGLGADTTAPVATLAPNEALLERTVGRRLKVEATSAAPPSMKKAAAPPTIARHTNTDTATVAPLTPAVDAAALPAEAVDAEAPPAEAAPSPGVAGKTSVEHGLERSFIPA